MQTPDELIRSIVDQSQIPSEKRRRAVRRELRSHLEDAVLAAREAGLSDDEIRQQVLAGFGDPGQVARGFAWVYRHERTGLRIAVFLLSTLAVAAVLSASMFGIQAGLAIGFGAPVRSVIAGRHTLTEALDILSTVAVYVGFIAIEKLFDRRRFAKASAILTLAFSIAAAGCAAAEIHAPFLVFGFTSGVFLRTIQVFMKNGRVRTGVAIACFAAGGFLIFQAHPSPFQYAVAMNCASWLAMGAGYHLMAGLAPRVDEALWNGLRRI